MCIDRGTRPSACNCTQDQDKFRGVLSIQKVENVEVRQSFLTFQSANPTAQQAFAWDRTGHPATFTRNSLGHLALQRAECRHVAAPESPVGEAAVAHAKIASLPRRLEMPRPDGHAAPAGSLLCIEIGNVQVVRAVDQHPDVGLDSHLHDKDLARSPI